MKTLLLSLVILLSFTSLAQPPAYVPTDSLVGWWPFNANANDESGSGNDGTVNGATLTTDRFGTANAAYDFDGASNIIVNNSSLLQTEDWSLSAWYKTTGSLTGTGRITSKSQGTGQTNYLSAMMTQGTLFGSAWDGATQIAANDNISTANDEWHHVVYTRNTTTNTYKLYIDDVLKSTENDLFGNLANSANLYIGSSNVNSQFWFGSLDDIGIWDRALTQCEVSGLYESQLPSCATSCLVAQYDFNGNADDLSGWGNHGTVNGATLTTDRFGNANSAMLFNGTSDFIDIGNSNSLDRFQTDFSISTWIRTPNLTTQFSQTILSNRNSGVGGTKFGIVSTSTTGEEGNLILATDGFTDAVFSSDSIWNNEWAAAVVTYKYNGANNNEVNFYINGQLKNSVDNVLNDVLDPAGINTYIGYEAFGPVGADYYFEGKIDDIKIYNCALTQCEISALYHAQTLTPPLVDLGTDTLSTCGATTTLDAGTDPSWASYLWNTTETTQSISISDPGLYLVEVTDTNGCIGYDTTLVTIINPTITPSDTIICLGDSVTLAIDTISGNSCIGLPVNLQNGLVAHYPFCGNANDESGNGNDGVVNGASLTADRFGNANSAYSFDGVDDYIEVLDNELIELNSNYTITAYVKIEGIPISQYSVISKERQLDGTGYSMIYFNNQKISHAFHNGTNYGFLTSSTFLPEDVFMIVQTYDGLTAKTYINGILVATSNFSAVHADSNFPWYFGKEFTTSGGGSSGYDNRFFNGKIDDIGIWNRALDATEIQQLFTLGQYDITWSTGDTTSSITVQPTTTTTYSVTVSDGISSCVDDVTVTVNEVIPNLGQDTLSACGASTTLDAGTDPTWASYLWNTTEDTQTISVSNSGLYTVEVTDTNGCIGYDTTLVSIIDPTIDQIDTNICIGDSLMLSVPNDFCSTNNRSQFPGVNRIAGADVQIGNKGYYGTGYFQGPTGPIFYNDFWEYDNLNDSWRQLPSYPGGVTHDPVIFNLNGNVFLGLGEPGNDELWMFEISTETWVQKSNFPSGARYNSAYFSIGDNGYVVCGFSNPVIHNDVWKYNSISDNWTQLSNFPGGGLRVPYGASQDGYGVVFGGNNGSSPSSEVWVFNPTTETWSQNQNNITASRSGLTVTSDGNNIIVSMGYDYGNNNQTYTDIYSYNLTTDSWTSLCSDSLIPMYSPINFIFGDQFFLAEGVITNQGWTFTDLSFERNMISSDISWSTGDTTSSITVQPTTTTTYSVTVSDGIGSCTDNATVTVSVPPVDAGTAVAICDGDNITLSGSGANTYAWSAGVSDGVAFTPTASEYYYVTGTDSIGCQNNDSVYVSVLQHTSSSITQTVCDTYTAPDGAVYTSTGNYTAVISNAANCDSTITIDLTVNNSTSSSITETACDTYTAPDGAVYTSTGNYTAVISNAANCDSTITIDLTVNNSTSSSITETACDTYTAPDGAVYTSTGNYTAVISNAANCDSTITIDLTVNNSSTGSVIQTACDTYTAPDGAVYTSTGNYTAVISNAANCDSTITIDLTVNNATASSISETALDSYTAPSGAVYTTSGVFNDTIANAAGCDSVITITLTMSHTGIEELNHQPIFLTPNPTSDFITIVGIENVTEIKSMKLVSSAGRVVAELKIGTLKIDVSTLSSGTYFLSITHANGTERIRFVKE